MTETQALTLTEFLLARIAEDEREAELATETYEGAAVEVRRGYLRHLARWSPARVLAECDAKRRIVEQCAFMLSAWEDKPGGAYPDMTRRERHWASSMLLTLASVYSDHPDYREEWRP